MPIGDDSKEKAFTFASEIRLNLNKGSTNY